MRPSLAAESLLPIGPAPETARAVLPAREESAQTFADFLHEELSTEGEPAGGPAAPVEAGVEGEEKPVEPWTWLGFAQIQVPPIPIEVEAVRLEEAPSGGAISPAADAPLPGPAAEQDLPSALGVSPALEEQIAVPMPEKGQNASGIAVAQGQTMQSSSRKQNDVPARKEQGTSFGLESGLAENLTPTQTVTSQAITFATPISNARSSGEKDGSAAVEFSLEAVPSLEVEMAGDVESIDAVQAPQMIEKIEQQVQILRTTGMDKMDVVLRPDADTELLIQVTKVDGQIQVQVRCERGDVALLDSQWSQVQSSLAAQGVKVEPLQHAEGSTDFSHSQFSYQKQRQEEQGELGDDFHRDRVQAAFPLDSGGRGSCGCRNGSSARG